MRVVDRRVRKTWKLARPLSTISLKCPTNSISGVYHHQVKQGETLN